MNIKEKVRASLRWRKNDEYCAKKLGIPVSQYSQIKKEIRESQSTKGHHVVPKVIEFKEDLVRGEATVTGISSSKPRTPEEIEDILSIDKTKWELIGYYNKERKDYWLTTAQVKRKKASQAENIQKVLEDFKFEYTPAAPIYLNKDFTQKTCAVLSLQDIHIGKETVEGINDITESVKKCIENLVMRSYHSCYLDKIIFVLGGDLLNADSYGGTTTSGTPVENSMASLDMYREAFSLMFWAINYLKQFCNELEVVYIPGNHDRLSSGQLAYSLSQCIIDRKITWNIEYAERKVISYGNSFIAVEHGDTPLNKSFFAFATEFPKQWGDAVFRTLYTGHIHKEKKVEYITADEINGFTMKILPSLSRTDGYHYKNKWTKNKRGGIIELHSEFNGAIGTFNYFENT